MTEIRRLFQQGKEFVPISLAEAVVVNTNNLPGFSSLKITTLDRVLYSLTGVVGTNSINIKNLQDTKQDKLTAGNGIVIKDGVISTTANIGDIYKIVSVLPHASAELTNTLYLVPTTSDNTEDGTNVFAEWLCVKVGETYKWEKLGESKTTVDLSDYITSIPVTNSSGTIIKINYEIPKDLYDNLMDGSNVTTN